MIKLSRVQPVNFLAAIAVSYLILALYLLLPFNSFSLLSLIICFCGVVIFRFSIFLMFSNCIGVALFSYLFSNVDFLPLYVGFDVESSSRTSLYLLLFIFNANLIFTFFKLDKDFLGSAALVQLGLSKKISFLFLAVGYTFIFIQTGSYSYDNSLSSMEGVLSPFYDYASLFFALFVASSIRFLKPQCFKLVYLPYFIPVILIELFAGRRVLLSSIFLMLFFVFSFSGEDKIYRRFGYLLYMPLASLLFLLLKAVLILRTGSEIFLSDFSHFAQIFIVNDKTSTELHSFFTTAGRFFIPEISQGVLSIIDPILPFISSFMGASAADFSGDVVRSGGFTLGGALPVISFASVPVILAPLIIFLFVFLLSSLCSLFKFKSRLGPALPLLLIASAPRALLYNFSILPRFLLLSFLVSALFFSLHSRRKQIGAS